MPRRSLRDSLESHLVEGEMPVPTNGVEEAAIRCKAQGRIDRAYIYQRDDAAFVRRLVHGECLVSLWGREGY
jgi:hypothetical protein